MRNSTAIRAAVLFLAAFTLLPVQLVWCDDDQIPRMKPAVNGQCLAGLNPQCCADGESAKPHSSRSNPQLISPGTAGEHNHCMGCTNELAHYQHVAQLPRTLIPLGLDASGGCLYSCISGELTVAQATEKRSLQQLNLRPPALALLHTQATHLLI